MDETGTRRVASKASRLFVGSLALALAIYVSAVFVVEATRVSDRLLSWADSAGLLSAYNLVFGILPTFIAFALLLGYWFLFRGTRGQLPAFIAIVLATASQVLANVWPYLTQFNPALFEVMAWIATLSALAVLLTVAIAFTRSEMMPRYVTLLAYTYLGLHLLLTLARLILRVWESAATPFVPQLTALIRGVQQYGGTGIHVAFLLALAFALLWAKPSGEKPLDGCLTSVSNPTAAAGEVV